MWFKRTRAAPCLSLEPGPMLENSLRVDLGGRGSRQPTAVPTEVGPCPRRSFLKLTGATTVAWYVATQTGWTQQAIAQIPGGTLAPGAVAKFQTAMLIPPVMPRAATITMPGGKPADYYEISHEADLPADPARRHAPHDRVGLWGGHEVADEPGAAAAQRALAHHRVDLEAAGTDQVDQRPQGRSRQLPAAPAARRSDLALGQPTRRRRGRDSRPTFSSTPVPTPARCRS